ncbi:MAG: hypothetical protein ACE5OO_04375, partial [Candidatus Bathyarchaeia archaeon]
RVKAWKAERFLTSVRSRIQVMEGKIRRLEGGLLGNVMATAAALRNVEMKLQGIRDQLASGEVEAALEMLDCVIEEIDEGVDKLNGRGASIVLREVERLEAKIEILNETAEKLRSRGVDTSRIEAALEKAEEILGKATEQLEEGDMAAAKKLLDVAGKILKGVEVLIHRLVHPKAKIFWGGPKAVKPWRGPKLGP